MSVFRNLLALGNILLGQCLVGRVGILIEESVTLVLGITIAFHSAQFGTVLCQFELALHDEQGEILAMTAIGVLLQGILRRNDAGLVVALLVGIDVAEITSQVVIELCRQQLLDNEFVL